MEAVASVAEQITEALSSKGAAPALDALVEAMRAGKDHHGLFDALILRKRHEMGLPLVGRGKLAR